MDSPVLLSQLFAELFNDGELRRFAGELSVALAKDLPGPGVPLKTLAFGVADAMRRHKLVDHDLFDRLLDERPHRRAEILQVKQKLLPSAAPAADAVWANGRYRLLRRIGEGGFAEVWQAADTITGEHVALKILTVQATEDERLRRRFLRGAAILGRLHHPGLVHVRDPHAREGDRLYCVMDHFPGRTLASLGADAGVPRARLLDAIDQVATALEYVHQHSLVHRDVNPNNILIDEQHPAKLIDFDLVGRAFTPWTATVPLGTLPYAAPELLDDCDDPTPAADIYGLAMTTLYVLLEGTLRRSVAVRDPEELLASDAVPLAMRPLLRAALHRDPRQRTPRVADFRRALQDARERPDPGASAPAFDTDGDVILWETQPASPAALARAEVRLWPAAHAQQTLTTGRRTHQDIDALLPFPLLLRVATVLALRGHRTAWVGLTSRQTPVLVLASGHLVLHDEGTPDPADMALAREHACIAGAPIAVVTRAPTMEPLASDVFELAQLCRAGARSEARLRQLARYTTSLAALDAFDVSLSTGEQRFPAVDVLAARLALPATLGLRGVLGSGKTHLLRLLAARLAQSALTDGSAPVVLLDATGWHSPLRLAHLLRDAGHSELEVASLRLAVAAGECILLVDGLAVPSVPMSRNAVAAAIADELRAFASPTSRIVLTTTPALLPSGLEFLDLVPSTRITARGARQPNDTDPEHVAALANLDHHAFGSLQHIPRLAQPAVKAAREHRDALPGLLVPALADYLQTWTARAAALSPGTTADDYREILECVAAHQWFGHEDIRDDAIGSRVLHDSIHCVTSRRDPELLALLADGAILSAIPQHTATTQWLADEAERLSAAPVEPFKGRAQDERRPSHAVYFVHEALLAFLLASNHARRLAAGSIEVLRGPRPTAAMRAMIGETAAWPRAVDHLYAVLTTRASAYRENALLLATADAALASTPGNPWQLTAVRMQDGQLAHARLAGADLAGADLRGADLRGAVLVNADLTGADLSHADLRDACCDGLRASNASFTGARLDGVSWQGADLRGASFAVSTAPECLQNFTNARVDGADLTGVVWRAPLGLADTREEHPRPRPPWLSADGLAADLRPDRILPPHAFHWINDVCWAHDGRHLVTIDHAGHACLWHADPLVPLHHWKAAPYGNTHLALSFDDRVLVTWAEGFPARLWDMATRMELHPGALATIPVHAATWARGSATLALFAVDGAIWIWDPQQSPTKLAIDSVGPATGRFIHDDAALLIAAPAAHQLLVYDRRERAITMQIPLGSVSNLAFAVSPDETRVAVKELNSFRIFALSSATSLADLAATSHIGIDAAVDWSPDGAWIAGSHQDHGPALFNVAAGVWSHHLQHGPDRWSCLRFSPDSARVVGVRADTGDLELWNTQTGRNIALRLTGSAWIHGAALSPDRRTLMAATRGKIHQWNMADLKADRVTKFDREFSVAIAPDASMFVAPRENALVLSDAAGNVQRVLDHGTNRGRTDWDRTHFTCDGKFIVCRVSDALRYELTAWDRATGQRVFSTPLDRDALYQTRTVAVTRRLGISAGHLAGHGAVVDLRRDGQNVARRTFADLACFYVLALDAAETFLAVAGQSNKIYVMDLQHIQSAEAQFHVLTTDGPLVDCLRFAPRGPMLAAASGDAVYVFDASTQTLVWRFEGHGFRVHSLEFSPDAQHLIVGDWDGQICIWDVTTGALVTTFHVVSDTSTVVTCGPRCSPVGANANVAGWYGTTGTACHRLGVFVSAVVPPNVLAAELARAIASTELSQELPETAGATVLSGEAGLSG